MCKTVGGIGVGEVIDILESDLVVRVVQRQRSVKLPQYYSSRSVGNKVLGGVDYQELTGPPTCIYPFSVEWLIDSKALLKSSALFEES